MTEVMVWLAEGFRPVLFVLLVLALLAFARRQQVMTFTLLGVFCLVWALDVATARLASQPDVVVDKRVIVIPLEALPNAQSL